MFSLIEYGLVFGSLVSVPFVLLTVLLVEVYARKEPESRCRTLIAVSFSPLLIFLVNLVGAVLRFIPFGASAADVVLGLMRPLGPVVLVINLIFSLVYLALRTNFFGE